MQAERGAFAHYAFATDFATVTFYHRFDHRQSQPQPFTALGRIKAPVLAKQFRQILRSNPWSLVADTADQQTLRGVMT
ncbi:Uncharacterised protein [Mycobacterium tuberculosis]|nr:Uncharacterised protein [Mycobacterium tuberculosis]